MIKQWGAVDGHRNHERKSLKKSKVSDLSSAPDLSGGPTPVWLRGI
jgi:hypothetical protein